MPNLSATLAIVGMLLGIVVVTLLVTPSLRRRDHEARRNPEDPDASLYEEDD